MDRKSNKVEKSLGRARNIQDRSKAWEEQNKKILAQQAKEEAERIEAQRIEKENAEWVDEDMENVEESTEDMVPNVGETAAAIKLPLPAADDEDL